MKNIKNIIIFILLFIVIFCYSFFISTVYNDEIWNYGFSYNISLGMIPYRDFSLVITPLFPMLASLFIKIFGNYLYSVHIFNSFILSLIFFIMYKRLNKKSFIIFPFIFFNCYPGYNILCVFIVILLLFMIDFEFKYKDFVFAFLVGLVFLTKQTVGIFLFIPMIYYSRDKLKSFISFIIPILIFIIYLIWNEAIYQFIDYCFLGLLDFGENNYVLLFLPIEIIVCFILIYYLYKSNFKNQKLFYLLMFQIITIPIIDDYHFMMGFIPVLYYVLGSLKIENYKLKYYFTVSLFFCFIWNYYVHGFDVGHLYSDKGSYLYGRNISKYAEDSVNSICHYMNDVKNDYDYIYFFSTNAYYVKLNIDYKITKYDMINNGNMGYKGSENYIKEIKSYCNNHKCMFILYKYEFRKNNGSQTNKELIDFVKNTYVRIDSFDSFYIYISS